MGFYALVLLFHLPWALMALTAALRMRGGHTGRLYRMQLEGSALALLSTLACWIIYDPHFGVDRFRAASWGEWFDRGEPGFFWIGMLLFMLGYLLERRPRAGLVPWPAWVRIATWTCLLAGGALAAFAARTVSLPWIDLPWPPSRMAFTLGCMPFAVAYTVLERRVRHSNEAE